MWFEMRSVDMTYLATAPKIYRVQHHIEARRDTVWKAFTDPATWRYWWPGVKSATYRSTPKPYGVGTLREATVGRQKYEEVVVAWDHGRRFAYYIERASVPIAYAQLESTELEDEGAGTLVSWTIAHEPRLLLRLTAPFFRRIMDTMLARAMANLAAHLSAERAAAAPRLEVRSRA